jgi:hypothetical protein
MECLHSGHVTFASLDFVSDHVEVERSLQKGEKTEPSLLYIRALYYKCTTMHAMELPVVKRLQIELTFDRITGSHREMKDRSKIYAMHDSSLTIINAGVAPTAGHLVRASPIRCESCNADGSVSHTRACMYPI